MEYEPDVARARVRAEMAAIERQAMNDQYGWREYLAQLSDGGRERAMRTLLDRCTFERWYALKTVLLDLERVC